MKVLVTGGAGYIGSHTCIVLLEQGYEVVIVDNLCNSKEVAVERIKELSGKSLMFYKEDVCNEDKMDEIFSKENVDAVIHFAGLKAVGESVSIPLAYYKNNLISTLSLLKVMKKHRVNNFVFSSSATVYGDPASVPIREDFPLSTTNPYGATKLMIEEILTDCAKADSDFNPILLRYFNPVGAHISGKIGEDPNGIPNNLVPYITQVAVGKLECVQVFGADYPTPDGTGVRDYIHVVDLAEGHVAALKLFEKGNCGLQTFNLGTGMGYSVLEMIKAFSNAVGREIPYEIVGRRPGDIPTCYADCTKAKKELHWKARKNLDDMCADSWRWQKTNPNGYPEESSSQPIVLASASPSRSMLLKKAGVNFEVVASGVDENIPDSYSPAQAVECLAQRKAEAVKELCPNQTIVAADSVVSIDGLILGKPKDDEDAKEMLRRLSGRTHDIYTGVCILNSGKKDVFHCVTQVTFYSLTEKEIQDYVAMGESKGRAGSYGIEGKGVSLIRSIVGDYSNIVGLPVAETLRRIEGLPTE